MTLDRRQFLLVTLLVAGAGPALAARDFRDNAWATGFIPDEPFDIEIIDLRNIPPEYRRQSVTFTGREPPGTLVIDSQERFLYDVIAPGRAIRYGIAVGRSGASWHGEAVIGRKAKWPTWTPTANLRKRNPNLPVQQAGGPRNPLGARALYLYQNGRDTLYRIHGTNEPWSIGKAVSSGCIRMLNEDVFELYGSVHLGTRVVVR